jgi:hypothetical protein
MKRIRANKNIVEVCEHEVCEHEEDSSKFYNVTLAERILRYQISGASLGYDKQSQKQS